MSMKRCGNGHYFDPAKHASCPYCGVQVADSSNTVPASPAAGGPDLHKPTVPNYDASPGVNVAKAPPADEGKTVAERNIAAGAAAPFESKPAGSPEGETVALIRRKTGIDPVVAWLVCVEGPEKGRDYRIRNEKNFIGRSERMDIFIAGDDSISRDNHAMISFNPRKGSARLHPGEGRGLVYLNGEELDIPTELKAYDSIEMGQSKFLFIPFCGENFKWD